MATIQQLEEGIRRADAAGDAEGVRVLGKQLMAMRQKPQPRNLASELGRQVGLTGRIAAEGLAGVAGLVADPINNLINKGLAAVGSNARTGTNLAGAASAGLDRAGVPRPQGTFENIVADAGRAVVGAAPFIGGGQLLAKAANPLARRVGTMLAEAPAVQGKYAAIGGGAAGAAGAAGLPVPAQIAAGLIAPAAVAGLPSAVRGVKGGVNTIRGKAIPEEAARSKALEIVAKAIDDDRNTPEAVAQMMDDAARRGVPLGIMDSGPNTRGLTSALARKPGPARTLLDNSLTTRQLEANDRIKGAIQRDLGPISNTFDDSDRLIQQARSASGPLYDEAYSQPLVNTPGLRALMDRPSMRKALSKAYRIAQEEGRDPASLGFVLDDAGNPVLSPMRNILDDGSIGVDLAKERAPSMQTMDYVKRGLDDVVEEFRDPTSNRLVLTTEGGAINATRSDLLKELDAMNPAYREARSAYAGPASGNDALWKGKKALNASSDELERMTARMGKFEREQFASGYRAAMADAIEKSGDATDTVRKLLGTERKRKAIAKLFGGEQGLDQFLQTLADEKMAFETYRRANLGSPTAANLADDAIVQDGAMLDRGLSLAGNAARGSVSGMIPNLLGMVRDASRFGVGKSADSIRNQAAALISETDAETLRQAIAESMRKNAARTARQQNLRGARLTGGTVGGYIGGASD